MESVPICKTQFANKIVAATCNGESAINNIFRFHFTLTHNDELNTDTDTFCKTMNFFGEDKCYIYFISDAPHLLNLFVTAEIVLRLETALIYVE